MYVHKCRISLTDRNTLYFSLSTLCLCIYKVMYTYSKACMCQCRHTDKYVFLLQISQCNKLDSKQKYALISEPQNILKESLLGFGKYLKMVKHISGFLTSTSMNWSHSFQKLSSFITSWWYAVKPRCD